MLAEALQAEVEAYIAQFRHQREEQGRRLVVCNGSHQPRPRASAFTTSPPRRIPPSSSTSTWSPTASAIAGSARVLAGVPSRLLPPWLDTEIAVDRPQGVVRVHDPLDHERPAPLLPEPAHVVPGRQRRAHPLAVGTEEGRRQLTVHGQVGSGQVGQATATDEVQQPAGPGDALRRELDHALRSSRSGMGGAPQSRRVANDLSRVMIRPLAPALRARSARASSLSRVPTQYIWKNTFGLAAATSSIGLL